MTHPILRSIRSLRRSLLRRTLLTGALRVFAAVALVACVLAGIDYSVRVDDPGVRLILSLAVIGILFAAAWRWLVRPLFSIPSDVSLARRMIQEDPRLDESFPTAIEFLKQSEHDPYAGSAVLRRAVVIEAQVRLEGLAWDRFVDRRPLRTAVALAIVPLVILAAVALWRPQLVGVGVARLAAPWGNNDWPRAHDLQFVKAPQRIPSGEVFEVELADRGQRLPGEVWIHYRFLRDGQQVVQREPMQRYGDLMVARREMVTQPFDFRATGGDDDRMAWRRLEVVEPPRLRDLELTLHPPAYSGLPPMASDRHVRAVPGTRIELAAQATHRLRRARVISEEGAAIEATIGPDGRTLRVPPGAWTVEETSRWSFELEDTEGLLGGDEDRISVHVSPDPPPSVTLERPANDQYVTSEAILPVVIAAKDNLAIRDIALSYLRSDQSDKDRQRIELYRGEAEPPSRPATSLALLEADRRRVEYTWDLSPLGLSPGTFLAAHAEASDYQGDLGQTALARNIYIVSLAELEARLAEQQDVLLGELERALQLQREARRDVGAVQIQLAELGTLAQREIDALQAVEINQRHIADLLANSEQGIASRIESLRGNLAANRIENPDIQRRLNELDVAIRRLAADHLPTIGRELTSALKTSAAEPSATERLDPSLKAAAEHQDAVIASLSALLGDFSRWSDYRRFARDISQLRADQQRLAQLTRESIEVDNTHADPSRLTPQALADREKVATQQLELARRLEALQQQMEKTAAELGEHDPLASTTLSDAVEAARRHGIDRRMRTAAEHVKQNQVGRALDGHAQIDDSLREVLGILRNTRDSELRRLVSKLREAEEDLQALRQELAGLRSKAEAASDPASQEEARRQLERLVGQQKELQQEMEQMSRRLMRLTAEQAGRSTARAAGRMGGDSQKGAAADRLREAERDLEQAQAELAQARRQAEADLAQEQLADMQTTLQSLADREERVIEEARRLENVRLENDIWTFGQMQSVVGLAEEQKLLQADTRGAAEKITGLGVVQTALEIAADEMERAAAGLAGRDTGRATQRRAEAALSRLKIVLAALDSEPTDAAPPDAGEDGGGGDPGGGGDQAGEEQGGTIELAELRLLKIMQLDLRERTAAAEADAADGEGADEARKRYVELAEEQGRLATLTLQLLEETQMNQTDAAVDLPKLDDALEQDDALPELDL